ncbi:Pimeloyl-ACP methyl ester carboxylesterase [Asanoa hainanensis]|uniref:Pimeloyl-ACP methyl ester carboxylesterase n=1 Tax=Asanoa hainanensis TaxID=560556 RepID=A0A239NBZ1_9ACTN|nr:alpha/beta hydrolase [Asanoa hainanensis]SNT51768.1 Pimeloyl-ACP methyl ester carboxylesterase [Asanoa hainanensis]
MDFALPDNRVLGWAEYGDPAGAPVVFLHGTPGSRLSRPDDGALAGIRLITVDRPGYGRSTPARRPTLLGVADAIGALTTSLGIERFGVVGFSGGAPYAVACGARFPHRLTGVVTAGFTGPYRELGTVRGWQRLQTWAVCTIPGLGRRYVTRAAAWYAEDPLKQHRALLASGQDTWIQRGDESNLEGARQGAAGLVNDWLATDIRRWGFRLRDVRCRTLVWAGRHDAGRAVPDAPLIAARMPDAEVRIGEDTAHTPSPADWREMLTWVTNS